MIDLLIPDVKEPVVDLYGKPELLFFGPDGELSSSRLSYILAWW